MTEQTQQSGVDAVRAFFTNERPEMTTLAARFVDDPEAVVDQASELFDSMIPTMAYVDNPKAPMAAAVFSCSAILAVYRVLAERGVDVHEFGSSYLEGFARSYAAISQSEGDTEPETAEQKAERRAARERFVAAAEASQRNARPGEFVYEIVPHDGGWGMNIKSCGICYQFSKHDAMDLVPYMCATDDVMSDQGDSGLRRTGTIAVGAHQCDFRYKAGGEPLHLAEQYPERIQIGRRPTA